MPRAQRPAPRKDARLAIKLAHDRLAPTTLSRATLGAQIYGPDDAVGPDDQLLTRATQEAAKLGAFSRPMFRATKDRLRGKIIVYILGTVDDDMIRLMSPSS